MKEANKATTIEKKALIIGSGIAGPVLAMYLQRAGITPIVYAGRPAAQDEAGLFMNIAPNGSAVLDMLGTKKEAPSAGLPTTSILFQDHRGQVLRQHPAPLILTTR